MLTFLTRSEACFQHLQEEQKRQTLARKWYLIVIVLLYVGLLASFSLNVSLLLRRHYVQIPAEITGTLKTLLHIICD